MTAKRKPERRGITWRQLYNACTFRGWRPEHGAFCDRNLNAGHWCREHARPIWKRLPKEGAE